MRSRRVAGIVACAFGAAGAAAWAGQATARLIIDGKEASGDVRLINGRPYVPVADVARSMGMVVTRQGAVYVIAPAGGAGQVEGVRQGKVGDELFTGKWRFAVDAVRTADEYTERYYQEGRTIKPSAPNDTLYILDCHMRNGLKQTQTPVLTERLAGNTAIADDQGQSYPPLDYDAREESTKIGSYAAVAMLPGARTNFTLVFSVPKTARPKALVFTPLSYPDDVGKKQTADVRVALGP